MTKALAKDPLEGKKSKHFQKWGGLREMSAKEMAEAAAKFKQDYADRKTATEKEITEIKAVCTGNEPKPLQALVARAAKVLEDKLAEAARNTDDPGEAADLL